MKDFFNLFFHQKLWIFVDPWPTGIVNWQKIANNQIQMLYQHDTANYSEFLKHLFLIQ